MVDTDPPRPARGPTAGHRRPLAPERVSGFPAVWVQVDFTRSGPQRYPAFVEQADEDTVYAQLVHMGFVHHVWLPRDRVTKRSLKPQGRR